MANNECKTRRAPCKACPWRVDAKATEIPGFDMEKAENLKNTVGQVLGQPMMACHQSKDGEEIVCVGFLAVDGHDNLTVRLSLATGVLDPIAVQPAPEEWGELHGSFDEMIEKLRRTWA